MPKPNMAIPRYNNPDTNTRPNTPEKAQTQTEKPKRQRDTEKEQPKPRKTQTTTRTKKIQPNNP